MIYFSGTDYPPIYHYIMAVFVHIQGSIANIEKNIYYLKIFTLIFDFVAGYFLIKILAERIKNTYQVFVMSLFYFLNIAVFYNSAIWGQVDGILACFVFMAFYFAYKNKILLSVICYLLALNFKLQAIVFLPLIGLIILPSLVRDFSVKKILQLIIISVAIQALILLPFILNGSVSRVWAVVMNSFGKYPYTSMNAYNMWYYFSGPRDPLQISDKETFMGMTYNKWGFILFIVASFVAMLPLIKMVLASLKTKTLLNMRLEKLLLTGSLVPLLFFYLNTQMHERYAHPAFIFLISYCILENKPFIGILASVAYLMNLEAVMQFLGLPNYHTLMFSKQLIATLYLLTIILLFKELYKRESPDTEPGLS